MKVSSSTALIGTALLYAAVFPLCSHAQVNQNDPKSSASTSAQASDALIVSGEWQHIFGSLQGGGGAFDWVHSIPRRSISLGVASNWLGGSRWTFGRGGVSFRVAEKWTFDWQSALGGGRTASSSFTYQHHLAGVTYRAASHAYIEAHDEFFDVAPSKGQLVTTAILLSSRHTSADIAYAYSIGGNLDSKFVSGRFDFYLRMLRPFAGFAVGQAAPQIFDTAVGQALVAQDLRQGLLGSAFLVSNAELTVAFSWTKIGSIDRTNVTGALKFPIGNGSRSR